MMKQINELLSHLKIWQMSLAISVALLFLGFTGEIPLTSTALVEGKSQAAIIGGVIFFVGAAILRYIPPPEIEVSEHDPDQVLQDIKFLLSFVPLKDIPKGLDPTFYHTGTYEGDLKLQDVVVAIKERYDA